MQRRCRVYTSRYPATAVVTDTVLLVLLHCSSIDSIRIFLGQWRSFDTVEVKEWVMDRTYEFNAMVDELFACLAKKRKLAERNDSASSQRASRRGGMKGQN